MVAKLVKSEYGEILQALDINFCLRLKKFGFSAEILAYDKSVDLTSFKAVVLSGGNDLSSLVKNELNFLRDEFEDELIKRAFKLGLPVLGVCKGAQKLASLLGASFVKTKEHLSPHEIELLGQNMVVNSYHNYAINPGFNADILALSKDGFVEAFLNKERKMLAMMWHFERDGSDERANEMMFEIFKGLM